MTHYVLLAGGLGNQLFQYWAAVSYGATRIVFVDFIQNERRATSGAPDILSLDLALPVEYLPISSKIPLLRRYFLGLLGSTSKPHSSRYRIAASRITLGVTSLIIKVVTGLSMEVKLENRLNQATRSRPSESTSFLIGYFQTLIQKEAIRNIQTDARVLAPSSVFIELFSLMERKNVIGVHIRRGDYVGHPTFGLLSSEYFYTILEEIWNPGEDIIIFSDSDLDIREFVPSQMERLVTLCPNSISASEVLILMSRCRTLVMSNSSLSWWSGYIGQGLNNQVIAPVPWFKSEIQAADFYHPKWIRRISQFV